MTRSQKIFVSYSHQDRKWLDKLMPFLRPLERDAMIQLFSDTEIRASSDWHAEIQTAITDADAAILLISQYFLASDYVTTDELPELLASAAQRGLRIFPVIVSSSHFRRGSPLLKFQAANSPSAPLDSLDEPAQNRVLAKLAEDIDELMTVAEAGVTEEWLERFRSGFSPIEGGAGVFGDNEIAAQAHALREYEANVDSFWLGKYVITQSEWTALMNTRPWANQKNYKYGSDIPAVYVDWFDAIDFVTRINKIDDSFTYRLPSELEWEYAARGGRGTTWNARTMFSFGNDVNLLTGYGWYDQNATLSGQNYAHPVGELRPNQLGLYDMHGNVWEWTADILEGYRPLRGGGFNFNAEGASSAYRIPQKPDFKGEAVGFRLIRDQRPDR